MKKTILVIISMLAICLVSNVTLAVKSQSLNQIGVDFNLEPAFAGDLDYLPLKPIAEYYGMYYNYDQNDNEINGRWNKSNFTLILGSKVAEVSNKRLILSNPVVKINGHFLIPIDFFEDLLKVNFTWSSTPSNNGPIVIKPGTSFTDAIKVYLMTNKNNYRFGEQVVVTLILKNTSQNKVSVRLNSSQIYDVKLSYQGRNIWQYSKGKMFTMALTDLEFEPNESKVYNFTLPEELILTPAQYELTGIFVSNPNIVSDLYYFNIQ